MNRSTSLLISDRTLDDFNTQSSQSLSPVLSDSTEPSSSYLLPMSPVNVKSMSDKLDSPECDSDSSLQYLDISTSPDSASVLLYRSLKTGM